MSPRSSSSFRLDDEILDALREIKDRDGIPLSEQVRRALLAWIEGRGVQVKKAERKRAATRKHS
jgi:hypothetical protein